MIDIKESVSLFEIENESVEARNYEVLLEFANSHKPVTDSKKSDRPHTIHSLLQALTASQFSLSNLSSSHPCLPPACSRNWSLLSYSSSKNHHFFWRRRKWCLWSWCHTIVNQTKFWWYWWYFDGKRECQEGRIGDKSILFGPPLSALSKAGQGGLSITTLERHVTEFLHPLLVWVTLPFINSERFTEVAIPFSVPVVSPVVCIDVSQWWIGSDRCLNVVPRVEIAELPISQRTGRLQ